MKSVRLLLASTSARVAPLAGLTVVVLTYPAASVSVYWVTAPPVAGVKVSRLVRVFAAS